MSTVVITHNATDIGAAIADALRYIDIEPLVRGKLVAVKPNETTATAEDRSGVTQPDTLRAVLHSIKPFEPRELVVSGGTGPLHGTPIETGLVIASTGPVAAYAAGAKLFGFNADAVHHLWEAGHLGLGETELDRMTFPALSLKDAISLFTEAAYGERLQFME